MDQDNHNTDRNTDHDIPHNTATPAESATPAQSPATPARPPKPIPVYAPAPPASAKRPGRSVLSGIVRSIIGLVLVVSIILNIYLGLLLSRGLQEHEYRAGNEQQKIALIDLNGAINMQTAWEFRAMLRRAERDTNVKAVILVVNSGGGQVAPSDMINRYIRNFRTQTDKKLYVAIEQVGASGAYWIAAAGEKIYAQENSLVGSIGVIYINLVLETALNEKLGITPVIIKSSRSPFKDRSSPFRMPTPEEVIQIQQDIDRVHGRFVKVVAEGRNLTEEQAWTLADADIWDASEAIEKQIIDKIGFLDDAIDDLAAAASLQKPQVVRYVRPPTLRELFLAHSNTDNPLDVRKQLEKWVTTPRIVAMWPGR